MNNALAVGIVSGCVLAVDDALVVVAVVIVSEMNSAVVIVSGMH